MLKYIVGLLSAFIVKGKLNEVSVIYGHILNSTDVSNGCVTFSISSGTGCAWMCNYCANSLETNNYYFTNGVCMYESGGCVGNPQIGVQYTCCAN